MKCCETKTMATKSLMNTIRRDQLIYKSRSTKLVELSQISFSIHLYLTALKH